MLRSVVDFRELQANSRTRAHPALLVRYRRNELGRTRYGISTGRRIGTAVARNKVRRRLREVLRRLDARVNGGWDILIVCRPPAAEASQAELSEALTKLFMSAGLLADIKIGNE